MAADSLLFSEIKYFFTFLEPLIVGALLAHELLRGLFDMIVTCLPLLFEMCLFAYCTHSIKMTSTKKVMTKVSRIQFIKCWQNCQSSILILKSCNSLMNFEEAKFY